MAHQQTKNYLNKKQRATGQDTTRPHVKVVRQLPDQTIHNPPGVMFTIGAIGILAGFAGNCWQCVTTFTAYWTMFHPKGVIRDHGIETALFVICGMMAFSFQFALIMFVFRLDSTWKKHKVSGHAPGLKEYGQAKATQFRATAIEVVQHVNLVLIWGALGFIIDTIGDFTFIGIYTQGVDPATSVFIIFCYAVALYALSTIAFVRSWEYIWAGFATSDNLKAERERQANNTTH
jgi:hypothetical protein